LLKSQVSRAISWSDRKRSNRLLPAIRDAVGLSTVINHSRIATMEERPGALAPRRFNLVLMGSFRAAFVLGAVGIYGVELHGLAPHTGLVSESLGADDVNSALWCSARGLSSSWPARR
jgi:hypothetical protein